MQRSEKWFQNTSPTASFAVRNRSGKFCNGPKKQSKYKLNATVAVRNRSGKICKGPKRSSQNTCLGHFLPCLCRGLEIQLPRNETCKCSLGSWHDSTCLGCLQPCLTTSAFRRFSHGLTNVLESSGIGDQAISVTSVSTLPSLSLCVTFT